MLDDTLLDDPQALAELDHEDRLRATATAGAQVRSAAEVAAEAGVGDLRGTRPRALVLLRRPGVSVTAVALLSAVLGSAAPVPVVVADGAPSWIGPLDVVLAHTADPTDAELADAVARSVRRGAEVVLSAPADGPVASAGAGRARLLEPRLPVRPGADLPRALAGWLVAVGALELLEPTIDPTLDELANLLDAEAERNQPGHELFMNPAKSLASRLAEHRPLLWGTDSLGAAVAGHGAVALADHAGVVAHAADIAQAATAAGLRRAVDLATGGRDVFHDPFVDDEQDRHPVRLVLVGTAEEDPEQVAQRRTGRGWPGADVLHPVDEVPRGTRHAALSRAMLSASRWDAAAVYLGLATRTIAPA